MKRISITPRDNWKEKLEALSFQFHSLDNKYWNESAYYQLSMGQVDMLEKATNELFAMCLKAVEHVIENKLYDKLYINPELIPLIERSWENEEPSFYGRFDLSFDGVNQPKMLEFNADTPTSLYEGSAVQWHWLNDVSPDSDQFNSIHERLLEYFKGCIEYFNGETVHFACISDSIEDFTTVEYLRDIAYQAGLKTKFVYMEDIGWNRFKNIFVDYDNEPIKNIFKLYPWEWIIEEEFGKNLLVDVNQTKWIEPAWKAILSNKGILPILWELFPNNPYLLPSYFNSPNGMTNYVEKPIYSREGANVAIYRDGDVKEFTEGEYGDEGYIYQQYVTLPNFDGNNAVIGSWVIDGQSAGIGIRESDSLITNNLSRFVPHLIK
jgi:glutathionylspermidine synthase